MPIETPTILIICIQASSEMSFFDDSTKLNKLEIDLSEKTTEISSNFVNKYKLFEITQNTTLVIH